MQLRPLADRARSLISRATGDMRRSVQPLPGLTIVSYNRPTSFERALQRPAVCLFLQGRKEASFGAGRTCELGRGDCWVVSHDVPVVARVKEAPSLAILFDLELSTLRSLYDEVADAALGTADPQAFHVHPADPRVVDALNRYIALAGAVLDAQVLGPMIAREIHYRLVMSPCGGMLRNLLQTDSHASGIARAIALIRRDFRSVLAMPAIARAVGMSPSLFYQQFKAITSCTPLQYQKELRLHEARRLLSMHGASVSSAAYDVGYESPNQFSREYARRFGVPPSGHLSGRVRGRSRSLA